MRKSVVIGLAVLFSFSVSSIHAQGPLAPAGAPGPTMKTLDQVEARTPITTIPITINTPGSYYLAGSLTPTSNASGISILSHDVTIDLNGFCISGTNWLSGIYVGSPIYSNIVIRNGSIEGWGNYGIDGYNADNLVVRDVQVRNTGIGGIQLGMNAFAENCQVINSGDGIGGYMNCAVRNCQVINLTGNGISLNNMAIVENSQITGCNGHGVYVGNNSLVKNCSVFSNRLNGISVGTGSAVLDNLCSYNALDGTSAHILSRGDETRIARNQLGQTGGKVITARGSDNVIADNVVLDALPQYDLSPTNSINILIHRLPVFLDWPCNAKVMGSLSGTAGISIQSDNVTLDLGGHTLTGTRVNPGVQFRGYSQVTVKNGTLKNWTLGIDGRSSTNCTLENVKIIGNNDGADLGPAAQVSKCCFLDNAGKGLQCEATARISDCETIGNGGIGITASFGALINRCVARDNGADGFKVAVSSEIAGCAAMENASNGISASYSYVRDNTCGNNTGSGIFIEAFASRVENNHVAYNTAYGIQVVGTDNILMRNTARQNIGHDYGIAGGNATGILVNVTGGGAISMSNPWVNFSY